MDTAVVDTINTGNQVEEGRFASTAGSGECNEGSFLYRKGQFLQRCDSLTTFVIPLGYRIDFDHGHQGVSFLGGVPDSNSFDRSKTGFFKALGALSAVMRMRCQFRR